MDWKRKNPFRKRVTPITLISGEEIYFIIQEGSAGGKISEPVPLGPLLKDEVDLSEIPRPFRDRGNAVMIVPDYWLGNNSFPFRSKKRSLAEAFLERKLRDEFPAIPDVKDFFGHLFYESHQGGAFLLLSVGLVTAHVFGRGAPAPAVRPAT